MDNNLLAFSIIAEAGDAKSAALEAASAALERDFSQAKASMEACEKALTSAHEIQTGMLREEMAGEGQAVGLLMVHAQDHLMGAGLMRELAQIIIAQYRVIAKLEGKG